MDNAQNLASLIRIMYQARSAVTKAQTAQDRLQSAQEALNKLKA